MLKAYLLVGLASTLGVADLGLEVAGLVLDEVTDTSKVCELSIGIDIHLHYTINDSRLDLVFRRARSAVED